MTYMREVNRNLEKLQIRDKNLFLKQNSQEESNPNYALNIAEKGEVDGIICSKGVAEKYGQSYRANLIIRANGDICMKDKKEIYYPITSSVKIAIELGAKAINFTYPASSTNYLRRIAKDFRKIQEEAHDFGLPVLSSLQTNNLEIKNIKEQLNLGSDILSIPYNSNPQDMLKQIKAAGKMRINLENNKNIKSSKELLKQIKEANDVGICGYVADDFILEHKSPIEMIKSIRDVQVRKKDIYTALKRLE